MDTKEAGAKGGKKRWQGITKKQRSEIMKQVRKGLQGNDYAGYPDANAGSNGLYSAE